MNVGDRIKSARIDAGITIKELATIINVSKGTIMNYESNKTPIPVETINKIAKATGKHPYIIAFGEESKTLDNDLRSLLEEINTLNQKEQEAIIDVIESMLLKSQTIRRLQAR